MRYLTEHLADNLSATTRMLKDHDFICSLVFLIEKAPWFRVNKDKEYERYQDNMWKVIPKDDLYLLGKVEAQVWIALYNLLLDPECQKNYNYNNYNHEIILRV